MIQIVPVLAEVGKHVAVSVLSEIGIDLYGKSGKFMKGTYTDGQVRTLSDCLNAVTISPETKKDLKMKKAKKKKLEDAVAIGVGIVGVATTVFLASKTSTKK